VANVEGSVANSLWRVVLVMQMGYFWRCMSTFSNAGRYGRGALMVASVIAVACALTSVHAQNPFGLPSVAPVSDIPSATLVQTSTIRLTGAVDSNSPAIWDLTAGRNLMFMFTSWGGQPSQSVGTELSRLGPAKPVELSPVPPGGSWIEAVVKDVDGTLYGYYHNERVATVCPGSDKVIPRIGALRSSDHGLTWEDLGIILEAPPGSHDCDTTNRFLVGGIGDFSVMLDADSTDLYIFFSQYERADRLQGVAIARMAWADRDEPVGKVTVWLRNQVWLPARRAMPRGMDPNAPIRWIYPAGTPVYPAAEPWHDDDLVVDAFWGPSVHWNSYLQQYVMLLNKAKNSDWSEEGIYVAFAPRLDDPAFWSAPVKILDGGSWYPQVMGIEAGLGTDKVAGEWARLFISGRSSHLIHFSK
jgi:hypothetical protein